MPCRCGERHDGWPDGKGGELCQECWEADCDESWWDLCAPTWFDPRDAVEVLK